MAGPSDDVILKIAADVASAAEGLKTVVESMTALSESIKTAAETAEAGTEGMDTLTESVKKVGEGAEEQEKKTKSWFETWITGVDQSKAAAVAWGNIMSQAFQKISGGLEGAITSFPRLVQGAADAGDHLLTMANRLNITYEAVDRFNFISTQSGVSMEIMGRSAQTLGVELADSTSKASKAFEKLGLSAIELRKAPDQALLQFIQRVKETVPPTEQAAKITEVLGGRARMLTGLLKENIPELIKQAEATGHSAAQLKLLAEEGDKWNDNLATMARVQKTWQENLALAVLPTLNSVTEAFPKLGGAVLTLGTSVFNTAQTFLPLIANISVLRASELGSYFARVAQQIPGFSAAMAVAANAVRALIAAWLPITIAIGAALAGFMLWKHANDDEGFWHELFDNLKYYALLTFGVGEASADAWYKTHKAADAASVSEREALEALAQRENALRDLNILQDEAFRKQIEDARIVKEAYEHLTTAEKARILAMKNAKIDQGTIAKTMFEDAQAAHAKYVKSLDALKVALGGTIVMSGAMATAMNRDSQAAALTLQQWAAIVQMMFSAIAAAEKLPLAKLKDQIKEFTKSFNEAALAGKLSWDELVKAFGPGAEQIYQQALKVNGGVEAMDDTTRKLAAAWRDTQWGELLKPLTDAVEGLPAMFGSTITVATQASDAWVKSWADAGVAIKKIDDDILINEMGNFGRRMALIDQEEAAKIEAIQKDGALDQAMKDKQIAALGRFYAQRRRLIALGREESDRDRKDEIAAEEAKLAEMEKENSGFNARQIANQKEHIANLKDLRQQDARDRRLTTIQMLQDELNEQENNLAHMKANRDIFNKDMIAEQQRLVDDLKRQLGIYKQAWIETLMDILDIASAAAHGLANAFSAIGDEMQDDKLKSWGESMQKVATILDDVNALMGAIASGNVIGMVIAAIKLVIDAVVALWDAFTTSPAEHVMKDMERQFKDSYGGMLQVSEEFGRKIVETSKKLFDGDRWAAEIFHLNDIINEAGGLTAANFGNMTARLRDVFALLESGRFSTQQATEVLEQNFGAFADHVLKSGKVASAGFIEIIQLNQKFGTQSKEIMDFVAGQTDRLGGALTRLQSPFATFTTANEALQKAVKDKAEKTVIDRLTKEVNDARTALGDAGAAMGRFERLTVASFNASIASGVPFIDAMAKMGPAIDQIASSHKALGTTGGAAIQSLIHFRDVAAAHQDVVESAGSLNEIMLAMSNIGGLNVETMSDLQAQGQKTFDQLIAAGFTEQESLQQMKGFLEEVRDAHEELGLPIDENTQALIDQGTETGVLAKKTQSANDIAIEGYSAIIKALGGEIPEAWRKATDAGVAAAKTIGDGVKTKVGEPLEKTAEQLKDEEVWKKYAQNAATAVTDITGTTRGLGKVRSSIADVATDLSKTPWDDWAGDAEEAARRAERAVDGVAEGHSPGGIKQIPIELEKSAKAFQKWEAYAVASANAVYDAISAGQNGPQAITAVNAAASSRQVSTLVHQMRRDTSSDNQMRILAAAMQRMEPKTPLEFHIEANAIDGSSMRGAFERDIVPMITDIIRHNTRGARTELRDVLRGGKTSM